MCYGARSGALRAPELAESLVFLILILLEASWELLEVSWSLWGPLGSSWKPLETSLDLLRPSWRALEPSWSPLEHSWRALEPSWRRLGGSWRRLGGLITELYRMFNDFHCCQWFYMVFQPQTPAVKPERVVGPESTVVSVCMHHVVC